MEFTKSLLKYCTDLSLEEYVTEINKLSPEPIDGILLNDLIDISSSKCIHHIVLIKYGIISKNTDIKQFLKLYIDIPITDGDNYYITNDEFKTILAYESHSLHDQYISVLRYIRWYQNYQCRLGEILDLKERYFKLNAMLSEIRDQYTKINNLKDGTELDISLEHEREGLIIMEKEIKKMKSEIRIKLDRLLYQ